MFIIEFNIALSKLFEIFKIDAQNIYGWRIHYLLYNQLKEYWYHG